MSESITVEDTVWIEGARHVCTSLDEAHRVISDLKARGKCGKLQTLGEAWIVRTFRPGAWVTRRLVRNPEIGEGEEI